MDRRAFLISSGAALTGIATNWSTAVATPPLPSTPPAAVSTPTS
ncbi:hypothetical protein [Parafrankia sp. CH37]|nr:hypothetical protein [Parafrankia sp. CH37]